MTRFELYRDAVLTCLVDHVVVHWDFDIRKLGSNSLALICAKFPAKLDCVIDKLVNKNSYSKVILLTITRYLEWNR